MHRAHGVEISCVCGDADFENRLIQVKGRATAWRL
jgi:hypothetical protein